MKLAFHALSASFLIIPYQVGSTPVSITAASASLNYGSCDQSSCTTKICDVSKKSCVIYLCTYASGCKRLRDIKLSDEDIRTAEARDKK